MTLTPRYATMSPRRLTAVKLVEIAPGPSNEA